VSARWIVLLAAWECIGNSGHHRAGKPGQQLLPSPERVSIGGVIPVAMVGSADRQRNLVTIERTSASPFNPDQIMSVPFETIVLLAAR
jgi:hypothetical protein